MKAKILLLVLMTAFAPAFGQKLIDSKKVPDAVKRTFKRKASRATEVKWFQKGHDFTAKYVINKMPAEAHITYEGKLTMLKTKVDPKKLPTAAQKDLRERYKRLKIYEVYNIVKSKRDKYYSVILHKSQGRKKPPLVYEVQYTLQGKFITAYEPDVEDNTQADTGPDKFDKDVDKDMDKLRKTVRDEKVKRKDLPTAIDDYLKNNFNYEYRPKDILLKSNSKYGQYYYIVMKKQGEKKEHRLWFDMYGKLLKKRVVDL